MICIDYACDKCKNKYKELVNGWDVGCKAYPDGIPDDVYFKTDVTKLAECNNGYKYTQIQWSRK